MSQAPRSPQPGRRVVAVVVTYNRIDLLRRLLDRLDHVAELAEVLVVDNASSDGTGEWLAGLAERAAGDEHPITPVLARTLAENRGGAGGFHAGLGWAMERGADLVWLMDDDGLPDPDCLDRLLADGEGLDFCGPLVVAEDDEERLVFPIRKPGTATVLRDVPDARRRTDDGPWLRGVVIPFNGVLLTRELVETIGLPREEFFIWGDDVEYLWRAERAGARLGTHTGARVVHPAVGDLGTPMAGGRTTYNHSPSDLKHYCMARNNLVNLRTYRGPLHALAFVAKTLWFYSVTRPSLARLRLSVRGMWAGLRGDFTGHRRYLAPAVPTVPASTGERR